MGTKTTLREEKRKAVVEALAIRGEPVHLVARVYNIPRRTVFDWLSLYRSGGWDALKASSEKFVGDRTSAKIVTHCYT